MFNKLFGKGTNETKIVENDIISDIKRLREFYVSLEEYISYVNNNLNISPGVCLTLSGDIHTISNKLHANSILVKNCNDDIDDKYISINIVELCKKNKNFDSFIYTFIKLYAYNAYIYKKHIIDKHFKLELVESSAFEYAEKILLYIKTHKDEFLLTAV